jgi:hypothetical protein
VLAGTVGMFATLTRPNALVLAVCAVWAAWEAVRRDRDWRALAAPLLTSLGFVGFNLYLWAHTGDATAWFRVEREAWHEHFDAGAHSIHALWRFVEHPWGNLDGAILTAGAVCTVVGLWWLRKVRLPAVYNLFAVGIVGQAFASGILGPRPRFVFTAFPLTIAAAVRLRGRAFGVVVVVISAVALASVIAFYTMSWRTGSFITPP